MIGRRRLDENFQGANTKHFGHFSDAGFDLGEYRILPFQFLNLDNQRRKFGSRCSNGCCKCYRVQYLLQATGSTELDGVER